MGRTVNTGCSHLLSLSCTIMCPRGATGSLLDSYLARPPGGWHCDCSGEKKEKERSLFMINWMIKSYIPPKKSEDKSSPKILVLHYPTLSHFSAVNWSIWCWFLLRFVSILTFQAELCFGTLRHDLASDTSAVYQNSHQNTWYHDCTRTATGTVYQIPLTPEQRLELVVSAEFRVDCSNLWKPAWTVELLLLMSGLWRR